jgi:hypothetical protein
MQRVGGEIEGAGAFVVDDEDLAAGAGAGGDVHPGGAAGASPNSWNSWSTATSSSRRRTIQAKRRKSGATVDWCG